MVAEKFEGKRRPVHEVEIIPEEFEFIDEDGDFTEEAEEDGILTPDSFVDDMGTTIYDNDTDEMVEYEGDEENDD